MIALTRRLRVDIVPRIAYPLVLFIACFALGALSVFQFPLNHDVSWILSMAEQVRGGTRLYVDIIELNPPLIIWLTIPVSAAAELAHAAPGNFFRGLVLTLALACIVFVGMILRGRLNKTVELSLAFVACYAAVAVAGYDFGQREHLAVLLSMPYLAMAVLRLNAESTKQSWRLIAALLATVGFAFKPYFLLVPFLVEGLVVLHTRRRPDGSAYVIAGFMTLYLAAILIFAPEYLPLAKMVSKVYGAGYLGTSPFAFLFVPNFQIAIICAAFAWKVRPAPRGIFHLISAAALGFAGAALIQNKGWSYHWYPAAALCWLLLGLAATAVISRDGGARASAAPFIVGLAMVILSASALVTAPRKGNAENPIPALFAPVIKELGGGPVMIFSNALRASYPLVTQPGIGSSSRLPTVALLSAAINSKETGFEKYLRDIVVADMLRKPPHLLIVETEPAGLPSSFNFIEYLSKDPVFARELTFFRPVRSVANFRFFQRIKPPAIGGITADTGNH